MRIVVETLGRSGMPTSSNSSTLRSRASSLIHPQVQHKGFGNLEPDREDGVERGHGVLEDHRDPVAADLPDLFVRYLEQVLAILTRANQT